MALRPCHRPGYQYPAGPVFPALRCDDSGADDSRKYPVCLGLSGRKKEKQQMVLSVQNPVAVPVEIKNNDIQTGKGDKKNHGIGLKNIQMVLDKYGGIGRIRCDKGWFYYTAVIPQTEEI